MFFFFLLNVNFEKPSLNYILFLYHSCLERFYYDKKLINYIIYKIFNINLILRSYIHVFLNGDKYNQHYHHKYMFLSLPIPFLASLTL